MSIELPEPPQAANEAQKAAFIERRDRLAARGPVTLDLPTEAVGRLQVVNWIEGEVRQVDAVGTVDLGVWESAMGDFTATDPTWWSRIPAGAFSNIRVVGFDDACVDHLIELGPQGIAFPDASLTSAGVERLRALEHVSNVMLGSDDLGDEALDVVAALDPTTVSFRLPKATGPALSDFITQTNVTSVSLSAITAEQLRTMTPIDSDRDISFSCSVAGDVASADVYAVVKASGASFSSVRARSASGERVLTDADYYRLQYSYPEMEIDDRWSTGKAIEKLAAKASVDLTQ